MEQPLANPNPDQDESDLLDFFILLAKYSRPIILGSLAATILFYLILVILPNTYTSTARLLPPQQNLTVSAQLMETLGGAAIPGKMSAISPMGTIGSLLGLKSPSDLYLGMMQCDTILDHIIHQFKLRQLYGVRYIEEARKKLLKQANLDVSKKDGIITVTVTDRDAKRSAALANAFVEELDKLLQRLVTDEAKERLDFLEKELAQTNLNLSKAEEALRSFSEKNSVIQIDTQTRGTLEYIAQLRAEIDTKEVQMQVMRYQATPRNSEMIRLQTQLEALKQKLQEAECKQIPGTNICLTTSKVPTLGLEYMRLYRQVKFQNGLYLLYSKMAEVARIDMVRDVAVVQFIDKAKPPEKRSNKRLLPTLIFGFGSFVVMIIVFWFKEDWEKKSLQREESPRWTLFLTYLEPWRRSGRRLTRLFKRHRY